MTSPLIRKKVLLPPPGWRKAISASATRLAMMRQGWKCYETGEPLPRGIPGAIERHHNPPLHEREYDPVRNDTIPAANDYRYIFVMLKPEHRRITKDDNRRMDKTDRLRAMQEKIDAAMTKECGHRYQRKGTIPSRPFPKRPKRQRTRRGEEAPTE